MTNHLPKKDPEAFVRGLKHVQLSASEKHEMRARLSAYADLHDTPVPLVSVFSSSLLWQMGIASFAVAVILVGGIGTSYAAADSLPGQPLYDMKVSVFEPIQTSLIPTTQGKAEWENVLAERRLTEASTLAAQNKLSPSTSSYLEQQVALHTDNAEKGADALAASGHNEAALAIRSDLEARLSAHTALLATIAPRLAASGDATTTVRVAALLGKVNNARVAVATSRKKTEVAISAEMGQDSRDDKVVAMATEERVSEEASLFSKRAATILSLVAVPAATTTTAATTTATAYTTEIIETTTVHTVASSTHN